MEIKILEESANRLVFEAKTSHTLCTALKQELWEDEDVKAAGYSIAHPLVGKPVFTVETKKGREPRKAVSKAIKGLNKKLENLQTKLKKIR